MAQLVDLVASNSSYPQFESCHRQNFIFKERDWNPWPWTLDKIAIIIRVIISIWFHYFKKAKVQKGKIKKVFKIEFLFFSILQIFFAHVRILASSTFRKNIWGRKNLVEQKVRNETILSYGCFFIFADVWMTLWCSGLVEDYINFIITKTLELWWSVSNPIEGDHLALLWDCNSASSQTHCQMKKYTLSKGYLLLLMLHLKMSLPTIVLRDSPN